MDALVVARLRGRREEPHARARALPRGRPRRRRDLSDLRGRRVGRTARSRSCPQRFMQVLGHTLVEGRRLSLGVDLTTGTGWPFGGPWVGDADASSRLELARREMKNGRLGEPLPLGRPQYVVAVADGGEPVDLTSRVAADGRLDWSAPGSWRVYAAVAQGPVQKVKRAAPGGEGNVVDPFSVESLGRYLRRFDEAFAGFGAGAPRAALPRLVRVLRGELHAAALRGVPGAAEATTCAAGCRRSSATATPTRSRASGATTARRSPSCTSTTCGAGPTWAHARGSLSRNQAHGAPGNLLDLYAAADIPETEVFRQMDEAMMPRLKLASSAAHVSGRRLASAEAFTWLGEHFRTPLSLVKRAADWLYLSGVNQLRVPRHPVLAARGSRGRASSSTPRSTSGREGGLWRDLPALTGYLTRVQSILQAGDPDADLLLYYSPNDAWYDPPTPARPDDLAPPNPVPPAFDELGLRLWRRGYSWDAVSERRLEDVRVEDGRLRLGGRLLPRARGSADAVPVARGGAPARGPRRARRDRDPRGRPSRGRAGLRCARGAAAGAARRARSARRGQRAAALALRTPGARAGRRRRRSAAGARRPSRARRMTDAGLQLVRRRRAARPRLLRREPRRGGLRRLAAARDAGACRGPARPAGGGAARERPRCACGRTARPRSGRSSSPARRSCVRTFETRRSRRRPGPTTSPPGRRFPWTASWSVTFVEGGPALPAAFETRTLASWTSLGDDEARRFAGTARYEIRFERPSGSASDWQLDLGDVRESARVRLNGQSLGTLWSRPFRAAARTGAAVRARTGSRSRSRTWRRTASATSTVAASRGRGSTTSTW